MTRLRESKFIDFNTGAVKVPPMQLIEQIGPRSTQTREEMLDIFECRVEVWQLGPAVEMLKLMDAAHEQTSVWAHSGYALLGTTFSYFEMVGKILNPASQSRRTSGDDFNFGFCDVYPGFAPAAPDRSDTAVPVVAQFRKRVRNGLYHLAYTKSHLYIHNQPERWPNDFSVEDQRGARYYFVNPHSLTRTIVEHFPTLMARLRDQSPHAADLHAKFVEFYRDFHQEA